MKELGGNIDPMKHFTYYLENRKPAYGKRFLWLIAISSALWIIYRVIQGLMTQ
jgi:hypothetical protein